MTMETVFRFFNEVGIINQLSSALMNKQMPKGLHISHFSVLNHCVRLGDGKTPLELARAFQVSKGTMTHTITVLVKHGFMSIKPHETDKRSKRVYITDEGRAFRDQAITSLAPSVEKLGGQMDIEAIAEALPLLADIRKVLDENRDI